MKLPSKIRHNYSKIYRIVLVGLSILLMVNISPKKSKFQFDYVQGFPWVHSPLYAPYSFGIKKNPNQIQAEKKEIIESSKLYFQLDPQVSDSVRLKFHQTILKLYNNDSTKKDLDTNSIFSNGHKIINTIYSQGLLNDTDTLQNKASDYTINIISNHTEWVVEVGQLYTISKAYDSIKFWTEPIENGKEIRLAILENIRPNLTFDQQLTNNLIAQKLNQLPPIYGKVNIGEKIVDRGEVITPLIYQKLQSLEESYALTSTKTDNNYVLAGTFIFISLALSLLILLVRLYSPGVYSETNSFTLILLLFSASFAFVNIPRMFESIPLYALPFVLFAIVLQSFFKNSLASIIYILMILLGGLVTPNGIEFIWIQIPAGLFAILLLTNLTKRSQIIGVVTVSFFTSSLVYFAINIIKEGHLVNIKMENFGWFAASAILTLLSVPVVYIVERLFGLISEMALLELADTNNKLLRQLAQVAPGTFQHSMQVANLAEECAIEIGGDPLLIRTGALYHDIGKMVKPEYFIENQAGGINPHNDLQEQESAKIIIGHVINGIELAKAHNLPEKIIDFIRTHHGTTTTRYFLHQAMQKDPNTNVKDFMYPGPLPFSKETAILMLCDGVEAAARSLKEYNAESINKLIDGIFTTIIESHQLDHAPITLENIYTLKKLLQKKIMNIYHVRVAYPGA